MKKLVLILLGFSSLAQAQTTETFNYSGAIVTWTVPSCVSSVTINVKGAQGGYNSSSITTSGLGASMTGTFAVTPGQQLKLLVGQQPNASSGNGGGGGTFVADMSNNPWIVAGGGGGSSQGMDSPMKHGQTTTSGGDGAGAGGNGGTLGNGGSIGASGFQSGAGGGFFSNGADGWTGGTGGIAFVNGGFGSSVNAPANGGFGGGGSGSSYVVGGGGGGYSGGGSGGNSTAGVGGGGGSFNAGTNQNNIGGVNYGNGIITITYFGGAATPTITGNATVCSASEGLTYTVVNDPAITSYNWTIPAGYTLVSGQGTNSIVVDAGTVSGDISVIATDACGLQHGDTLTINMLTPSTGTDVHTACESYTWIDGQTYFSSNNTATYVLQNAVGCDSVVTLDLTIHHSSSDTITTTACDIYSLNGIDYTSSGTYIQLFQNVAGCDSTLVLNLTINNSTSDTITDSACDTYSLNGFTYYSSGTYTQTLQNMAGCDSTLVLNLTINQSSSDTITETVCDEYVLNGITYNNSGTYLQTFQNTTGCDSTLVLNLTIKHSSAALLTETACDSYTLNNITYTSSGTYVQTLQNMAGCDSTLTLSLMIQSTVATAMDNGDGTITASGGTGFQWIDCSTNSVIQGATNSTFVPSLNGNYAVIVTDNNCSDTSACVEIDYLSLSGHALPAISLFPNPAKDHITVQFAATSVELTILDAQGKQVKRLEVSSGQTISINDLENGVYMFEFSSAEGIRVYSIVKQ